MNDVHSLTPAEVADQAATNTGQYYCISEKGGIVARGGRPLFATLEEWHQLRRTIPGLLYVPTSGGKRTEPLFGSLPLFNTGEVPDMVGRLISALSMLEAGAQMVADRVEQLDKRLSETPS